MGISAEKKSFGYGGECFEGAKLHGGAFSEEEAQDFSARPHELISLLASGETSCSRGPGGFVGFESGARIHHHQVGELQENEEDQNQIEEQNQQQQQQRKKELRRAWREEWRSKHRWVYPIKNADGELRLKCSSCSYFNMDNVFAREGCSTIQMSALTTHAKSEAHKAAESRINSSNSTQSPLPAQHHEGLLDGSKSGEPPMSMHQQQQQHQMEPPGGEQSPAAKKRKLNPVNPMLHKCSGGGGGETLASVVQKNNSRVVQLLVDAENGRNARHATNVSLAKKQIKLEEQRLQVEQQLLEQDRARLNAHVSLGHSFIAALTDIGEGLKRIGNAMEARKTSL